MMNLLKVLHDNGTIDNTAYEMLISAAKADAQNSESQTRKVARQTAQKSVSTSVRKEVAKATGEMPKPALPKALQGLKVGILGYADYSAGQMGTVGGRSTNFNRFTLTRGYFTVKKEILPWMRVRMTTDIHQDATEDWKVRLKYLYTELRPSDFGFLTSMKSEIGLGHTAWLDFEEHVNPFRAQGTMAIERAGIFNSADIGISLRGNLGGTLEDARALTGNHHYDGRYGSWHLGVYNGGGYHATEKNRNKVLQGRITVRPLPDVVPGLQLSYLGIFGKGNTALTPDYDVNLGMLSYENPRWIFTAQYFDNTGNASGSRVNPVTNTALDGNGYSFFGRVLLPVLDNKLGLFARYDNIDPDVDGVLSNDAGYQLSFAGLSYQIYKNNMLILGYEQANHDTDNGGIGKAPIIGNLLGDDRRFQAVYQMAF